LSTKAKINLKEGTIELEGSEAFVSKYLNEFKNEVYKAKVVPMSPTKPESAIKEGDKRDYTKPKRRTGKISQTVVPIPLDLKGKGDKPSLREFYKQKKPKLLSESVTVFAYYLKKHLNTEKMEAGHVVSCCKEVKIRVPKNIPQMFYDVNREKGWLNVGKGNKFAEINTAGENFVEYDLPRKKDAAKDKKTT
jgi:hypothetical protein